MLRSDYSAEGSYRNEEVNTLGIPDKSSDLHNKYYPHACKIFATIAQENKEEVNTMQKINLKIQKLDEKVTVPCYQTEGAAGMDLCAFLNEPVTLKSLERKLIPTGLKMELPHGYEAQVRPRSGMSIKHGITLVNCVGTIDEDYRGELCVPVINLSTEEFTIQNGDRIAQMIVAPVTKAEISVVTELSDTQRGEGGFGSTGKN